MPVSRSAHRSASEFGQVLADVFLERGFDVETSEGWRDFYLRIYTTPEHGRPIDFLANLRVTPEARIYVVSGTCDRNVEAVIRSAGIGSQWAGQDSPRVIQSTIRRVVPSDDDDEPAEEESEEGPEHVVDPYDGTYADEAVKYLRSEGAVPSGGDWFYVEGDPDWRTGEIESRDYHLKGFTAAEENEIFERMKSRR